MKFQTIWTDEETKILIDNYANLGGAGCSKLIKTKTTRQCFARANHLKLKFAGKHTNFLDLTGKEFGYLKVKHYIKTNDKGNAVWFCECKCGNSKEATGNHLKLGNTKSCGCLKKEANLKINRAKYKGGKYITGTEFCRIKQEAKYRNIEFSITIEDIEKIYENQNKKCSLSGIDLIFNTTHYDGGGQIINGNASIDRIDSSKGYTVNNIQIVDIYVNRGKSDLTQQEYIEICKKVAKNND